MNIRKRLETLENGRFNAPAVYHRVVQNVGQSPDEAIFLYGRDRIGQQDCVIIRRVVAP